MPRPVPALSVYISLHPAAGTIMMPLFRCGKKGPCPKAPSVAELGLGGWAASLAADSPRGVWAREPETNVQSECKRQLLPGDLQAWSGMAPNSLPITQPLPTQAGWRMRLEPREHGLALAVPKSPLWAGSRHLPAPCKLRAQGQAGSSCHFSPAPVLSSLLPQNKASHTCSPRAERC